MNNYAVFSASGDGSPGTAGANSPSESGCEADIGVDANEVGDNASDEVKFTVEGVGEQDSEQCHSDSGAQRQAVVGIENNLNETSEASLENTSTIA